MNNPTRNRPAPLIEDLLNLSFGDIAWAVCYPDNSYAIGIKMPRFMKDSNDKEHYGRAVANARGGVLTNMGYDIIQAGWMKPRGVEAVGPVVIFRHTDGVKYAPR